MSEVENSSQGRPNTVIDPVCGMIVVPGDKKLVTIYKGKSYWFCARACRETFEENPLKFLLPKSVKRKGWFGRFLDRIGKANEEQFGCAGPKCH